MHSTVYKAKRRASLHTSYDGLDRLIDADRADSFDQSWTLDGLGNFRQFDDDGQSQTRTANAVNEITAITGGWATPAYDLAGNMIFAPKSGDETTGLHFVRDAWNRQVAVYEDDGDGLFEPGTGDALLAEYEFDGRNRRIEKLFANDTSTDYFYNEQWQLLEERSVDSQGATTAMNQYVWSQRYIDAPIVRFRDGNADGDLLDPADNTRYYTGDANFNVTAMLDTDGTVISRYAYSAYGESTVYDDAWSNPDAATEDGPLYCGYWFDAETGNSQVRARGYVTAISTFDATDPLLYQAVDVNLYRYVHNSPINRTDPEGLIDCTITIYGGHNFNCLEGIKRDYPEGIPPTEFVTGVGCGVRLPNRERLSLPGYICKQYPCNSIPIPGAPTNPLMGVEPREACKGMMDARSAAREAAQRMLTHLPPHATSKCPPPGCDTVTVVFQCDAAMGDLFRDGTWRGRDGKTVRIPKKYWEKCEGMCGSSEIIRHDPTS